MGYTTDANYLLQAGKDLAVEAADGGKLTDQFDAASPVPWHSWGEPGEQVSGPYDYVRASMVACMAHVENLLNAYAEALRAAGNEYLLVEQENELRFRRPS